jgi:hypothetical protein
MRFVGNLGGMPSPTATGVGMYAVGLTTGDWRLAAWSVSPEKYLRPL